VAFAHRHRVTIIALGERAHAKPLARNRTEGARGVKIYLSAAACLANHLALIRSFLIDSDPSAPSRAANCAKFFCCAHLRDAPAIETKFGAHARKFYARRAFANEIKQCKMSLFHSSFCNVGNYCAIQSDALTQTHCRTRCVRRLRARTCRMRSVYTFR